MLTLLNGTVKDDPSCLLFCMIEVVFVYADSRFVFAQQNDSKENQAKLMVGIYVQHCEYLLFYLIKHD